MFQANNVLQNKVCVNVSQFIQHTYIPHNITVHKLNNSLRAISANVQEVTHYTALEDTHVQAEM